MSSVRPGAERRAVRRRTEEEENMEERGAVSPFVCLFVLPVCLFVCFYSSRDCLNTHRAPHTMAKRSGAAEEEEEEEERCHRGASQDSSNHR